MKHFRLVFLLFVFPVFSACDWQVFDDFEKQATVQVIEPPRNFVGTNFGQVVGPVLDQNGQVVPNVFLAGGNGTTPLAIVRVDETTGAVSRKTCRKDMGTHVSLVVPLPAMADGKWRALLADGNYQNVELVSFDPAETEPHLTTEANVTGVNQYFGAGVVAGDLDGDRHNDIAVASRDRLYIFDETLQSASSSGFDYPQNFLITLPQPGSNAMISFRREEKTYLALGGTVPDPDRWAVLLIAVNSGFELEMRILEDPAIPGERICSLTAGDIDSDGFDELVVGLCNHTLIYKGGSGAEWFGAQPERTIGETGMMRGKIVAVTDINQDGRLEIVISDPQFSLGSDHNGEVIFYDAQTGDQMLRLTAPPNEKYFGSSLFSLRTVWKDNRPELVVGGGNVSYLYFLTGLDGDDDPLLHDPRR